VTITIAETFAQPEFILSFAFKREHSLEYQENIFDVSLRAALDKA
jgi:hypothetical protein